VARDRLGGRGMRLACRIAVITRGASGIGRGITLCMAREGA
jgi:NAD(P)-dependent dehydrogenase (short-subunit alcohol dehydrogenase family)